MFSRGRPGAELLRLAALQDGVVTREQSLALGLSRKSLDRLVRDQHWRRLTPGLFFTAGLEPGWRSLAWAGVLAGGDHARLGGLAAAHLHGLTDQAPDTITVLVPHHARVRCPGPWVFRRERRLELSRARGNPPRLDIEGTVLAVCADAEVHDVVGWVTAAVQRRLTTPTRLRRALGQRQRQPHRRLILSLIADVAEGAHSPLEVCYLHQVERAHGLPDGRRQHTSRDGRSERDAYYDEQLAIVELDGRIGHDGLDRFRDMWRDNIALVEGRVSLRYGSQDVTQRPCEVAFQVGQLLRDRGWTGLLRRCPNCRQVA